MTARRLHLSQRAQRTTESPINHFMQQAVENPNLISLAAGLVDADSLPAQDMAACVGEIFARPDGGRSALQYGTTAGYAPLRERVCQLVARLDGVPPKKFGVRPEQVVVTTGSQQMLHLLAEVLLDPGDIVVTEAPSYFVQHGVLASHGANVFAVPMDEEGMETSALENFLLHLKSTGQLERLKLIYLCDYFQNPTGLTLSVERRLHLVELVQRFSVHNRIVILEDAAYRELGFSEKSLPSIMSLDRDRQHVVYAGTFSKPCAPGLKTGYALLPEDLVEPVLRFKGLHDFGSANFNQHMLERFLATGAYDRHVVELRRVYKAKKEAMLLALDEEFADWPEVGWTNPQGGMFVWLSLPEGIDTGPGSPLLQAAVEEGMLYVPGEFCHVPDVNGNVPINEMRLCYGVERPERIREAVRRLRRATRAVLAAV
ncbi:MAG TPA: PLP-dependent aminotransferase family protein [Gemmataceae bacterium]|nr:PLP-dependent aminotransferase family protein [Gemmataceae bacterium]